MIRLLCICSLFSIAVIANTTSTIAADVTLHIDTPVPPPGWAVLERELLRTNAAACEQFFKKYFDDRGWLLCVERWGGDDGPDDAIENCQDWPILHALGADDVVLKMYKKAWEGHLRQFTLAKTTEVPMARDGMYYKEFCVQFDWFHHGEGLVVFNLQGLSDPKDIDFQKRARRFAGFYMNEDPGVPNYDAKHKIIKSLFNGSRGPLLRKATGLDWAGDPIEVENRFRLGHGEKNYAQMVQHFEMYNDIVGDNPLNLRATTLALNAYMLAHEEKYKRWVLDYIDAWRDRMAANNNIIPSNIGLDGKIGGECNGKWYGGVYGWAHTTIVPQDGSKINRNYIHTGFQGFANAYFLTGDDRYLDAWRKQTDAVNSHKKVVNGQTQYPHMYGDEGWYGYSPQKFNPAADEIYYLSQNPSDRERVGNDGWWEYLEGKNPNYPEQALRRDFGNIRNRVEGIRRDPTTPDTRLSDDPMKYNPASIRALHELMQGGFAPGKTGSILHCRVRYFDADRRRAGIPQDVAALIEKMTADSVTISLVNTSQLEPRTVVVQAGGYGEHQFTTVSADGKTSPVNASKLTVRLAPGSGTKLALSMKRYANAPSLAFPWDR